MAKKPGERAAGLYLNRGSSSAHAEESRSVVLGLRQVLPAEDMRCGKGTIRCLHPIEIFGDDWFAQMPDLAPPGVGDAGRAARVMEPRG